MSLVRIHLPWPSAALNPNARGHWSKRSTAAKAARLEAMVAARAAAAAAGWFADDAEGRIEVTIIFHPPDRRTRDLDNMLASLKPSLDGVADGMHVNDRRFRLALEIGEPVPHGKVAMAIRHGGTL